MTYTLGSMFAGIGGMELGFEATGQIETKWQVEIDDYANKVLEQHWPSVARWRDVRTFPPRPVKDWKVDIIAGGFPCQDISTANGNARGLDGERSGLFSEIVRVAGIIRPRAIVLENVAALYFRGLDRVLGALAQIGYDAEWHCVSAASVGAPHRRDRVFIIALANAEGERHRERGESGYVPSANGRQNGKLCWKSSGPSAEPANVADPNGPHSKRGGIPGGISAKHTNTNGPSDNSGTNLADAASVRPSGPGVYGGPGNKTANSKKEADWIIDSGKGKEATGNFESRVGGVADGFSQWMDEPDIPRITSGIPKRAPRLRCLGNAIVPQVAEVVARRLLEILEGNGVTDDTKQKAIS